MADTYTATLDSGDGTEQVELELVGGAPQKSFVRPTGEEGVDEVWELDPDAEQPTYRKAGFPEADYS